MCRGTREFIGARVMIGFVAVYALVAMALAQAGAIQILCFAGLGMAWILPLMPLIKWMEKPDPGK